jgi:hypothetical protein
MIELQESTWGTRLNEKHYSKFDIEAPDWAKNDLGHSWYAEGIVIWDETEKIVVNLNFWDAMTLLEHLRDNQKWKERGQDVSEEEYQFSIPIRRRRRSKSAAPEEPPPIENTKIVTKLHLSPDQTQKLLDFLEQNEQIIRGRGKIIKDEYDRGIKWLVKMLHEERSRQRNQEGGQD